MQGAGSEVSGCRDAVGDADLLGEGRSLFVLSNPVPSAQNLVPGFWAEEIGFWAKGTGFWAEGTGF